MYSKLLNACLDAFKDYQDYCAMEQDDRVLHEGVVDYGRAYYFTVRKEDKAKQVAAALAALISAYQGGKDHA